MSIAALITEGIGPGGSIPYLLTEGLDIGTPAPPTAPVGGHWGPPLTKAQLKKQKAEIAAIERAREAEWAKAKSDIEERRESIRAAMHPERILGVSNPPMEMDEDETDIEMLLLYG